MARVIWSVRFQNVLEIFQSVLPLTAARSQHDVLGETENVMMALCLEVHREERRSSIYRFQV